MRVPSCGLLVETKVPGTSPGTVFRPDGDNRVTWVSCLRRTEPGQPREPALRREAAAPAAVASAAGAATPPAESQGSPPGPLRRGGRAARSCPARAVAPSI